MDFSCIWTYKIRYYYNVIMNTVRLCVLRNNLTEKLRQKFDTFTLSYFNSPFPIDPLHFIKVFTHKHNVIMCGVDT